MQKHINAVSNKKGKCSFCKTDNATLIKPEELFDRFEPLLELYEKDREGVALNELLQIDWNVFTITVNRMQQKLLKAISCNNDLFKVKFKPVFLIEQKNVEQWENFREELKHRNRFFPNNAPVKSNLEPFGKHIGVMLNKGSQIFFRARINTSDKPYKISQMSKPLKNLVSNGRANPIGIPYLYLASSVDTAISEIRGNKGEFVTIAEFIMNKDLELADLRDPKNTISPFELNEENELELIYKNMPFLTLLGNELSKPIIPREANLEYLPSQYLCELLKNIGFHGIIYKSSIANGNNYVIFDDKKLKAVRTYQYQITDITTKSKKLK
ncbi:MAG: RES domain-containing protein [Nitrospirota bacterium]|nr:RES domain-containing protein [Nitrospirota bacterium]